MKNKLLKTILGIAAITGTVGTLPCFSSCSISKPEIIKNVSLFHDGVYGSNEIQDLDSLPVECCGELVNKFNSTHTFYRTYKAQGGGENGNTFLWLPELTLDDPKAEIKDEMHTRMITGTQFNSMFFIPVNRKVTAPDHAIFPFLITYTEKDEKGKIVHQQNVTYNIEIYGKKANLYFRNSTCLYYQVENDEGDAFAKFDFNQPVEKDAKVYITFTINDGKNYVVNGDVASKGNFMFAVRSVTEPYECTSGGFSIMVPKAGKVWSYEGQKFAQYDELDASVEKNNETSIVFNFETTSDKYISKKWSQKININEGFVFTVDRPYP